MRRKRCFHLKEKVITKRPDKELTCSEVKSGHLQVGDYARNWVQSCRKAKPSFSLTSVINHLKLYKAARYLCTSSLDPSEVEMIPVMRPSRFSASLPLT